MALHEAPLQRGLYGAGLCEIKTWLLFLLSPFGFVLLLPVSTHHRKLEGPRDLLRVSTDQPPSLEKDAGWGWGALEDGGGRLLLWSFSSHEKMVSFHGWLKTATVQLNTNAQEQSRNVFAGLWLDVFTKGFLPVYLRLWMFPWGGLGLLCFEPH